MASQSTIMHDEIAPRIDAATSLQETEDAVIPTSLVRGSNSHTCGNHHQDDTASRRQPQQQQEQQFMPTAIMAPSPWQFLYTRWQLPPLSQWGVGVSGGGAGGGTALDASSMQIPAVVSAPASALLNPCYPRHPLSSNADLSSHQGRRSHSLTIASGAHMYDDSPTRRLGTRRRKQQQQQQQQLMGCLGMIRFPQPLLPLATNLVDTAHSDFTRAVSPPSSSFLLNAEQHIHSDDRPRDDPDVDGEYGDNTNYHIVKGIWEELEQDYDDHDVSSDDSSDQHSITTIQVTHEETIATLQTGTIFHPANQPHILYHCTDQDEPDGDEMHSATTHTSPETWSSDLPPIGSSASLGDSDHDDYRTVATWGECSCAYHKQHHVLVSQSCDSCARSTAWFRSSPHHCMHPITAIVRHDDHHSSGSSCSNSMNDDSVSSLSSLEHDDNQVDEEEEDEEDPRHMSRNHNRIFCSSLSQNQDHPHSNSNPQRHHPQIARKERSIVACLGGRNNHQTTMDLWRLRHLALTPGGLISAHYRQQAWPALMACHELLLLQQQRSSKSSGIAVVPRCNELQRLQHDAMTTVWNILFHWHSQTQHCKQQELPNHCSTDSLISSNATSAFHPTLPASMSKPQLSTYPSLAHPDKHQQHPPNLSNLVVQAVPSTDSSCLPSTMAATPMSFLPEDRHIVSASSSSSSRAYHSNDPPPMAIGLLATRTGQDGESNFIASENQDNDDDWMQYSIELTLDHNVDESDQHTNLSPFDPQGHDDEEDLTTLTSLSHVHMKTWQTVSSQEQRMIQGVVSSLLKTAPPNVASRGVVIKHEVNHLTDDKKNQQERQAVYHYYTGLADLAAVLLINLQSPSLSSLVLHRLAEYHLSNTVLGPMDVHSHNNGALDRAIVTVFFPLLALVDPVLYQCLMEALSPPRNQQEHEQERQHSARTTATAIVRSWVATWFVSEMPPTHIASVSRLMDAFMVSHPVLPIYVVVALLVQARSDLMIAAAGAASLSSRQGQVLMMNHNHNGHCDNGDGNPNDNDNNNDMIRGNDSTQQGENHPTSHHGIFVAALRVVPTNVLVHPRYLVNRHYSNTSYRSEDSHRHDDNDNDDDDLAHSMEAVEHILATALFYMKQLPPQQLIVLAQHPERGTKDACPRTTAWFDDERPSWTIASHAPTSASLLEQLQRQRHQFATDKGHHKDSNSSPDQPTKSAYGILWARIWHGVWGLFHLRRSRRLCIQPGDTGKGVVVAAVAEHYPVAHIAAGLPWSPPAADSYQQQGVSTTTTATTSLIIQQDQCQKRSYGAPHHLLWRLAVVVAILPCATMLLAAAVGFGFVGTTMPTATFSTSSWLRELMYISSRWRDSVFVLLRNKIDNNSNPCCWSQYNHDQIQLSAIPQVPRLNESSLEYSLVVTNLSNHTVSTSQALAWSMIVAEVDKWMLAVDEYLLIWQTDGLDDWYYSPRNSFVGKARVIRNESNIFQSDAYSAVHEVEPSVPEQGECEGADVSIQPELTHDLITDEDTLCPIDRPLPAFGNEFCTDDQASEDFWVERDDLDNDHVQKDEQESIIYSSLPTFGIVRARFLREFLVRIRPIRQIPAIIRYSHFPKILDLPRTGRIMVANFVRDTQPREISNALKVERFTPHAKLQATNSHVQRPIHTKERHKKAMYRILP